MRIYQNPIETKEARKSRFLAIGVAKEIKKDPEKAFEVARVKLSQMQSYPHAALWIGKWQKIIDTCDVQDVIRILVCKGIFEQDLPSLRQMSPFVGLMSPLERNLRLKKWKKITSGI